MKKSKLLLTLLMAGLMATSVAGIAACDSDDSTANSSTTSTESSSSSSESTPGGNEGGGNQGGGNQGGGNEGGGNEGGGNEGGGNEGGGNEGGGVIDPDAPEEPVITIAGGVTEVTANLGEAFTLPVATATDNKDATVEVFSMCQTADIVDGEFTATMLGKHTVDYYAVDSDENESFATLIVNVVSDTYAETADVTGYNSLANLTATDGEGELVGGTFKENFEKHKESPLMKNVAAGAYVIEAGENAINGNSMVLDYVAVEGKENRVFLNTVPLMTGKWTVSFDVKLISGTGFDDFYVGYVKDGTISSIDQPKPLSGMAVGDVRRITWETNLVLEGNAKYYFHFFRLNQTYSDNGCVMAFDNFEFTYAPPALELPTTVPSIEELEAGYTYDWENTYMPIGGAELLPVSQIENADAKAAIEGAASGFGANVVHLTGSGSHDLTEFTKAKFADFFTTNWTYTIEFDYYAVANGSSYLIAYDGTAYNHTVGAIFSDGLQKGTIKYTVAAADNALTLYATNPAGMDIYLGNFKITGEEPTEIREDFHSVTNEEMLAEGGYTYDLTENNVLQFSNNVTCIKVEQLKNPALVTELQNSGKYTTGYAMKYEGTSVADISCLTNKIVVGNTYTFTLVGYNMGGHDQLIFLQMGDTGQIGSGINVAWTYDEATHTYTGTASFKALEGCKSITLFGANAVEFYFASINIAMSEPVEEPEPETPTAIPVGAANLNAGGKGVAAEVPAGAAGQKGFTGDYGEDALKFTVDTPDKVMEMIDISGATAGASSVQITIYYYVESLTDSGLYLYNGAGSFNPIKADVGYNTYTVTFVGGLQWLCLYMNGTTTGTVYVGGIDVVVTK